MDAYTISKLGSEAGVSVHIVRDYVVRRLLHPAQRTNGDYGIYDAQALGRLRFVRAPFIGWLMGRLFRLDAPAVRAIAFSAGPRNSLVVLPLALAVPGAIPVLPAIIVKQTLVELVSELIYVRLIPKLTKREFTTVP